MRKIVSVPLAIVAAGACIGIGAAIGSSGGSPAATPQAVATFSPAPTVTVTAPAVTKTVQAPAPAAGGTIAKFKGSGNEATPHFNVPDSGSYTVAWSYSGNYDTSFGSSQASNFAITENGSGVGIGLPNDIAGTGHGSTEVTDASGTDSFDVQAAGSWTIVVTSD